MKVLLVARESVDQRVFRLLAQQYSEPAVEWQFLFEPVSYEAIGQMVAEVDFVLCGMSAQSSYAETEIFAAHFALQQHKYFGFFANCFGVIGRPYFQALLSHADLVFTVNQDEAVVLQKKYPEVHAIASGHPLWEKYAQQDINKAEIRQKHNIPEHCRLIVSPGGKNAALNVQLWSNTLYGAGRLLEYNTMVWMVLHPDDITPLHLYQKVLEEHKNPHAFLKDIGPLEENGLAAADLVVQSASAVGVTAAIWNIPVIDFILPAQADHMQKIYGQRTWPPVSAGASVLCTERPALVHIMSSFLKRGYSSILSDHQDNFLVFEKIGSASQIIGQSIKQLLQIN